MKLTNMTLTSHRRKAGILLRHRLARRWPEAAERMITPAEMVALRR